MNAAQIHLLLNHVPMMAVLFGLILLAFGQWRSNPSLSQAGLISFMLAAALVLPVDWSGEAAEEILESEYQSQIERDLIHEHEEKAETSIILTLILGGFSLSALVFSMRYNPLANFVSGFCLVFSIGVFISMLGTAHSGGLIRHPEIRAPEQWERSEKLSDPLEKHRLAAPKEEN